MKYEELLFICCLAVTLLLFGLGEWHGYIRGKRDGVIIGQCVYEQMHSGHAVPIEDLAKCFGDDKP